MLSKAKRLIEQNWMTLGSNVLRIKYVRSLTLLGE
jgi:hypothetical protein